MLIKDIAPGLTHNYFLAEDGSVYMSDKSKPTQVFSANLSIKFKSISSADYFMGIGMNGRLYIWGHYG